MKIAAVVVTYNRLTILKQCIDSLRNQTIKLDEIIVINNSSTDETLSWLNEQDDLTIITQENLGSSGGQFSGIKRALEENYEWIWCLEDEIAAEKNCLEELINLINSNDSKVSAVSAIRKNRDESINIGEVYKFDPKGIKHSKRYLKIGADLYHEDKPIEIYSATFEGLLVNSKVVSKSGLPNKHMFLWFDDVEFCSRLNRFYPMYLFPKAIVYKNSDKLLSTSNEKFKSNFLKELYGIRNLTYIEINRTLEGFIEILCKYLSIKFYYLKILKFYIGNLKISYESGINPVQIIFYPILCMFYGYKGKLGKLNFRL